MDLFYGSTVEEQLKALKKDIKAYALSQYNYDYGHKKIYVAYGSRENIGNNILIVVPPLVKDIRPYEDKNCLFLRNLLAKYSISNTFVTPNFLIPIDKVSKADIKGYSQWIAKLTDIIQPKFVVALGEDSMFAFFKRKAILRDCHGTVVGQTIHGQDVILSYAPDYYTERSEYEDPSFKNFISDNDWKIIATKYKEMVHESKIGSS